MGIKKRAIHGKVSKRETRKVRAKRKLSVSNSDSWDTRLMSNSFSYWDDLGRSSIPWWNDND